MTTEEARKKERLKKGGAEIRLIGKRINPLKRRDKDKRESKMAEEHLVLVLDNVFVSQ